MAQRTALIVGGGIMGLATGCALAEQGVAVTVLERFTIGHAWASSHGLTRAIRHEYGPDAIYTQMVARSLTLWDELARATGRHLYTETGVLTLGQADDGQTLAGYDTMRAAGLPVLSLTSTACQQRFPQFDASTYSAITYNPRGGMLHASKCLLALAERLQALGGTIRTGVRVARVAAVAQRGTITLDDGAVLRADRVVVTAGPWVNTILTELQLPIWATRQQVCYLAGLPAAQFGIGVFPVFLAQMQHYGFPLLENGWLKIGSHVTGAAVDPDIPYTPDVAEVDGVHAFLQQVIPTAAAGEVVFVDRCMYDMSPDEDFILDYHPNGAGVVIGSGFSGHGFKFGVVIGRLLAALALDQQPEFSLDRFRLQRFSDRQPLSW